jgi:hypothetical protein
MSNPAVIEAQSVELLRKEVAPVLQRAQAIAVRSPADREDARNFVLAVKKAQDQVHASFDAMVDKTHKAWKESLAVRASFLDPLESAEKTVKRLILNYDADQERIRLDEQRRLQAIADETARKERERLEKEAAKLKTPELREARLEQAALIVAPVVTISEPEKPKGESAPKRWKARLLDKMALIQAAANGSEIAIGCLTFDQPAANTFAKSSRIITVPGIEWYSESSLSMRGE